MEQARSEGWHQLASVEHPSYGCKDFGEYPVNNYSEMKIMPTLIFTAGNKKNSYLV